MALTVGELVAYLGLNRSEFKRGLSESKTEARMAGESIARDLDVRPDGGGLRRYAQAVRDLGTLYGVSVRPVRDWSVQVAKTAAVAGAAATAIGGGVGLTGAVFSLGSALGSLIGLAPVAGAALLGYQAASITAKIGTYGVAEAIKERLGDAFDKVSPKAQAFVDEVASLGPALVSIKNDIQDDLFAGLDGQLSSLADRYLPLFSRVGQALAAELNGGLDQLVGGLMDPATAAALGQTLGSFVTALRSVIPGIGGLIPLLAQVLAAGGPAMERIGVKVRGALERFKKSLADGLESGGIEGAIDSAVEGAANLGGVLADVLVILYRIGQAAGEAFGDPLGSLREMTTAVREWVSSARGQAVLTGVFKAFAPVLTEIGDTLKLIAPELLGLLPIIRDLALAFLAGLQPVIPIVGDLLRQIGGAIVALLPFVSQLAVLLGDALGQALEMILPLLVTLAPMIVSLVGAALEPFLAVIRALTAPEVLPVLVAALVQVAQVLGVALADAITQIAPMLPVLVQQFAGLLLALLPLLPVIVALIPPLVELAVAVLIPLTAALIDLAPAIIAVVGLLGFMATTAAGTLTRASESVTGLIVAFRRIVARDGIPAAILAAAQWILSLPSRAASLPGDMLGLGGRAILSLQSGVNQAFVGVARWFGNLPSAIAGAVPDLSGVLVSAGGQVISGLVSGIRNAMPDVKSVLGTLTGAIPQWKGPPARDRDLLTPAGRSVIAGLVTGIEAEVPTLRRALEGVTNLIPADAGSLSMQANREAGAALTAEALAGALAGRTDDTGGPIVVELTSTDPLLHSLLALIDQRVTAADSASAGAAYAGSGQGY